MATIGGVWDDRRVGRPPWFILLGAFTGLSCVAFVVAFFVEAAAAALGRLLLPMALLSSAGLAIEASADFRRLGEELDLTDRTNNAIAWVGIGTALALFAPAITLGTIAGLQQWQAAD
jgi:hypothetical protein